MTKIWRKTSLLKMRYETREIHKTSMVEFIEMDRQVYRPPDKSVQLKFNFLISCPKHMFWILKRTVSKHVLTEW